MAKIMCPEDLVKEKEFKNIFTVDENDKKRKIFCKLCPKSIVSRSQAATDHI